MSQIFYLTQITLEAGALRQLPAELARVGIRRPLVVTDAGIRAAGVLDKALAVLQTASLEEIAVYDGTPSNPTEASVRAAQALVREHRCDGLVALGGGSAIDCAKGVAIAATMKAPSPTMPPSKAARPASRIRSCP